MGQWGRKWTESKVTETVVGKKGHIIAYGFPPNVWVGS